MRTLLPVWGVGRLRLSCTGIAEPQSDKCNGLRLFCFHTEGTFFVEQSETLWGLANGGCYDIQLKKWKEKRKI